MSCGPNSSLRPTQAADRSHRMLDIADACDACGVTTHLCAVTTAQHALLAAAQQAAQIDGQGMLISAFLILFDCE